MGCHISETILPHLLYSYLYIESHLNFSSCLQDELQLTEWLTSSKALSKHLLHVMKEEATQQPTASAAGTISLAKLITRMQWLSQASIGLNNVMLACVTAHACSSADDSVKCEVWAPAAAAILYSMLDPATASVRLAAVEEFKGRGEAERNRSANLETLQVSLLVTWKPKQLQYTRQAASWSYHVATIVVKQSIWLSLMPCLCWA